MFARAWSSNAGGPQFFALPVHSKAAGAPSFCSGRAFEDERAAFEDKRAAFECRRGAFEDERVA